MSHRLFSGSLLGLMLCLSAPLHAFDRSDVEKSVVRIISDGGSGSGTVINDKGDILTNHHVIEGSQHLVVISEFSDGEQAAQIRHEAPDKDLAVIRAEGLGLPVARLLTGEPEEGVDVAAMGYPGAADREQPALKATLTEGILSHSFPGGSDWPVTIWQHTATVSGGNSGGPLFDACGRVIGVNTQRPHVMTAHGERVTHNSGINWASHIKESVAWLENKDVRFQADASSCTSLLNTYMALIAGMTLLALGLALRKPRQEIIRVAGHIVEPISRLSKPGRVRPKADSPQIVLTGFEPRGRSVTVELRRTDLDKRQGGFTVGRHPLLVDQVLNDDRVSRRHARFSGENGAVFVEDLNSSSGTTVNEIPCAPFEPTEIRSGDIVGVGGITLRVSY